MPFFFYFHAAFIFYIYFFNLLGQDIGIILELFWIILAFFGIILSFFGIILNLFGINCSKNPMSGPGFSGRPKRASFGAQTPCRAAIFGRRKRVAERAPARATFCTPKMRKTYGDSGPKLARFGGPRKSWSRHRISGTKKFPKNSK